MQQARHFAESASSQDSKKRWQQIYVGEGSVHMMAIESDVSDYRRRVQTLLSPTCM